MDSDGEISAIEVVCPGSDEKEGGLDGEAISHSDMEAPGSGSGTLTAIDCLESVRCEFQGKRNAEAETN